MRSEVKRNGELRLNERQRRYIAGVRAGKSRRQAALLAGYSPSSANNPGYKIERRGRGGKPIMRYFWDLLKPPQQHAIPPMKGMGAKPNDNARRKSSQISDMEAATRARYANGSEGILEVTAKAGKRLPLR